MGEGERENSHLRRDIFSLFTEERDLENCWGTRKRIFLVLNMTENKKKIDYLVINLIWVSFSFCFVFLLHSPSIFLFFHWKHQSHIF
jgi:hypothetical protein